MLIVNTITSQSVSSFKLFGMYISEELQWQFHIDAIRAKVATRIYFLKHLKRAGHSTSDLRMFSLTVVRTFLEYGCCIWNHGLTKAQVDKLEALQKGLFALYTTSHMTCLTYFYWLVLICADLSAADANSSGRFSSRFWIPLLAFVTFSHRNVLTR